MNTAIINPPANFVVIKAIPLVFYGGLVQQWTPKSVDADDDLDLTKAVATNNLTAFDQIQSHALLSSK